ncbi:MAG: transcription termination factor NusA [Pseudomonadota bacterium]
MISDLKRIIDQVSKDKGIDCHTLVDTIEEAIRSAAKKRYGPRMEVEVALDEETGDLEVFQFKEVVEEVEDPQLEISFEDGRDLDPDCQLGDSLGTKMDTVEFGRIAAQSAKQVIIQRIKEAERDVVYDDYKDRKGEIINGIVQRFDKGSLIVNLGRAEAVVPPREQVPREGYRQGDRVRALVLDVKQVSKGPQIILSRTHPDFLRALFRLEVPEIEEGIVNIVNVAREPGHRSKISVTSEDSDIDPVGACVGMRGARVQSVVQELRGEKIDIISWNPDSAKFVCNALAPAEVCRVIIDKASQSMEVVVSDEQLSLAIGKQGQNVRLASKLAGWKLDVVSETKYKATVRKGYESLVQLGAIGEVSADSLSDAGFSSIEDVARSDAEEMVQLLGLTVHNAERLVQAARDLVALDATKRHDDRPAEGSSEEPAESVESAESVELAEPVESAELRNANAEVSAEVPTEDEPSGEDVPGMRRQES